MNKLLSILLLTLPLVSHAIPEKKWISIDNKILESIKSEIHDFKVEHKSKDASIIKLTMKQIKSLSSLIHKRLHRCGGFSAHASLAQAQSDLTKTDLTPVISKNVFKEYFLDQQELVQPMVEQLEEGSIRDMIIKLSSYNDRNFDSQEGLDSSEFIKQAWADITMNRSDVKIEYVHHLKWSQPSIILTIEGSEKPEEVVILGGHIDSISDDDQAPGADDNASGVASMTEVLRVMMQNDFKPKRTIKIMGYAAEEVGLLGSAEIARSFKKANTNVVGVIQLDMTLFHGTKKKDIVLMKDFTNRPQNEFIGKIIDEYVKVPWGYSECGYGCSDHASWTSNGFAASFPFESKFNDHNPNIHTKNDLLENAGGNADHSLKFAKMALAYLVEIAN